MKKIGSHSPGGHYLLGETKKMDGKWSHRMISAVSVRDADDGDLPQELFSKDRADRVGLGGRGITITPVNENLFCGGRYIRSLKHVII